MRTSSKPHLKKQGACWSVYLDGRLISSWPTLETAWLRFKEYNEAALQRVINYIGGVP